MADTLDKIPSSARPCEDVSELAKRPPKVIRPGKAESSVPPWVTHGEWVGDTRLNG